MPSTAIRILERGDYDQWLPLWEENCQYQITPDVTAETWRRITDEKIPVNGFGLWEDGVLVGILHYILHPVTGMIEPVCYMQDVFIRPESRMKGYARDLVLMLNALGQNQKWGRIYWIAQTENVAAQGLYKALGHKLDFSFHVLPIVQGA